MPKLYYPGVIITDLWARKIAQRSSSAIKSHYFLMHLDKWAVIQYHSTQRAQLLLGHQPSCSFAFSLGSKVSGSGTKDMVFVLKFVEYTVPIDEILYLFFF